MITKKYIKSLYHVSIFYHILCAFSLLLFSFSISTYRLFRESISISPALLILSAVVAVPLLYLSFYKLHLLMPINSGKFFIYKAELQKCSTFTFPDKTRYFVHFKYDKKLSEKGKYSINDISKEMYDKLEGKGSVYIAIIPISYSTLILGDGDLEVHPSLQDKVLTELPKDVNFHRLLK